MCDITDYKEPCTGRGLNDNCCRLKMQLSQRVLIKPLLFSHIVQDINVLNLIAYNRQRFIGIINIALNVSLFLSSLSQHQFHSKTKTQEQLTN